MRQDFLEVESVFTEVDAPKPKELIKVAAIQRVHINTAGDDTENTGNYYVWVTLGHGAIISCFEGTLSECQAKYEHIKMIVGLDTTEA